MLGRSGPLPRSLVRYGIAIVAVALAVLLRWLLVWACGELPTFITFALALCAIAMTAGGGPTAVVTVLSVAAAFTVIPASGRLHPSRPADLIAASIALFGGGIVSWIAARLERSRRQLLEAAEHRGAEEALRRSEEQFRAFFNTSAIGTAEVSPDGRFLAVNDCYCQITGYSREELLGLHPLQLCHPDDREHDAQGCMRHLRGELPAYDAEKRYVRKNGQIIWVRITAAMSYDAAGKPLCSFGITQDITDRKRAEESLRESEERFRTAFENGAIPMTLTALDGALLKVNAGFAQMLGRTPAELVGRNFGDFTHPDDLRNNCAGIQQVASGEARSFRMEKRYLRNDGSIVWGDMNTAVVPDAHGKPLYLVTHIQDITERKQAEQALRQSESRYRRLMQSIPVPLGVVNKNGETIYFNDRFTQVFGYTQADLPTLDAWWQRAYPDPAYRRRVMEHWQAKVRRSEETRTETEPEELNVTCQDGTTRVVVITNLVIEDCILAAFIDITGRKRAEMELERMRAFLSEGERIAHLGTWQWDASTGQTVWSEEEFRIYGLEPGLASPSYQDLMSRHFHPDDAATLDSVFREAIRTGSTFENDHRIIRPDGTVRFIHNLAHPHFDASGKLLGYLGATLDITERKQAEEELKAAKAAAEQAKELAESASRAKDQFIAVLSHELRTPLTPALTAVSMMEKDLRLPAETREDLAMVRRNIALEVHLIADLLDVSRVVSGKLHLDKRPTDVADAIREAAKIVSGELDAKGQTLSIETPQPPYLTFGDAARLQQVFWNLLRNAIKFTPHRGHIAIRASVQPVDHCPLAAKTCPVGLGDCPSPQASAGNREPCGGNLLIAISDTGIGIAPETLSRLFAPFEQGGDGRGLGGLGLGLSICKAVVEMHGGTISADSAGLGQGATFTMRLPIAQCPLAAASNGAPAAMDEAQAGGGNGKAASTERSQPIRILLVEDHADTARMMSRLLRADGHEVSVADSVGSALAMAEEAAGNLDLLISDLGLPDGDGRDLMRQLRKQGRAIPGIALSGYGAPADIDKSRAAGFAEHLVKPTSPHVLAAAIQRVTAYQKDVNSQGRRRG